LAMERGALPPARSSRKSYAAYAAFAALVLAICAVAGFLWLRKATPPIIAVAPSIKSIAVLPLKPLGNEESDRTLSLGLTDTLVTRLGSLHSIVVRPVSNAGAQSDSIEIGRKLRVDAVLEATVQRTDSRLRLNARLLRVGDGALIWS